MLWEALSLFGTYRACLPPGGAQTDLSMHESTVYLQAIEYKSSFPGILLLLKADMVGDSAVLVLVFRPHRGVAESL
jgi:hypothetical protein